MRGLTSRELIVRRVIMTHVCSGLISDHFGALVPFVVNENVIIRMVKHPDSFPHVPDHHGVASVAVFIKFYVPVTQDRLPLPGESVEVAFVVIANRLIKRATFTCFPSCF